MHFAQPEYLYLLFVIPAITAFFVFSLMQRKRRLKAFGNPGFIAQFMPDVSTSRPYAKFTMLMLALAVLIVAVARPQFGQKQEVVKSEGLDVMIAIDISNSMLAEDMAPSRLGKAKQMLAQLLGKMENNRVGLVVFAGDAFVQMPITADYVSANMFLSSIAPDLIAVQGTAIGAAIERSLSSFDESSEAGKAIILITDGENHEDDAAAQAVQAAKMGVKLIVVGIGTPEGAPIPLRAGSSDFRKDRQGQVVVSRLNEAMAQEIAQAGGGIYLRADQSNTALRAIQAELDKLDKAAVTAKNYREQAVPFLWLVLILLAVEVMVLDKKSRLSKKLFGK
jgi:Ca-activated chloride channel family protein